MKSIYLSLALFLSVTVCFGQKEEIYEQPFTIAEMNPDYPGGLNSLQDFITSKIEYPKLAIEKRTQGKVILKFVVERDGTISNITIKKDIGDGCGEEAVRVLKMGKKWIPARQYMKPVRAYYILPVYFNLPPEEEPTDTP